MKMVDNKSDLEQFMHNTLRPVLKFQHDYILALINAEKHIQREKIRQQENEQQQNFLSNYISKNNKLRATLIGSIAGLFISSEIEYYLENKREIDRRIVEMAIVRYTSTL